MTHSSSCTSSNSDDECERTGEEPIIIHAQAEIYIYTRTLLYKFMHVHYHTQTAIKLTLHVL